MADGKFVIGKPLGGTTTVSMTDSANNTNLVLPESGTVATTSNLVGFKNYIINGNFSHWQYSQVLPYPQTSSGYGSDDRWGNFNVGTTKSHSLVNSTDTERALFSSNVFSRTVVTSVAGVNNNAVKEQGIEDVNRLAGKTVTISFWAKADSTKNIAFEISQSFGIGGSPSANVNSIGSQLIALTKTWQKKTITVNIPSIVGKTIGTAWATSATYIRFWFDAGSSFNTRTSNLGQQSGTFDIAQVQLEEGSIATPFENRDTGLELSLCQRYYEISPIIATNLIVASNSFQGGVVPWTFKQTKRVQPTIGIMINNGTKNGMAHEVGVLGCSFASAIQATNVADYIRLVAVASAEF